MNVDPPSVALLFRDSTLINLQSLPKMSNAPPKPVSSLPLLTALLLSNVEFDTVILFPRIYDEPPR